MITINATTVKINIIFMHFFIYLCLYNILNINSTYIRFGNFKIIHVRQWWQPTSYMICAKTILTSCDSWPDHFIRKNDRYLGINSPFTDTATDWLMSYNSSHLCLTHWLYTTFLNYWLIYVNTVHHRNPWILSRSGKTTASK